MSNLSVVKTENIAQSGSHRRYVRQFLSDGTTRMAVFNEDVKENEAFFAFTAFFREKGIPVPEILEISDDRKQYLLEDLGDELLFTLLQKTRQGSDFPTTLIPYYQRVLQYLPKIQLCGKQGFDFSKCYPVAAFDRRSMQWDLNYFKYYFLKLAYIPFDEQKLEDDFQKLCDYLMEVDQDYFLYRDFQSRNIMLHQDEIYFIDYQGGRKGALQYDVASLLYQAKAALPESLRDTLLEYYLDELEKWQPVDRAEFKQHYYGYVLIRLLQVLGAYGYRGYYEKKQHFLQSIPPAVENIRHLMGAGRISIALPELSGALQAIAAVDWQARLGLGSQEAADGLTVVVSSFSYKKGIPADDSSNGGGFVFDCRALPNPGREAAYRSFTGCDACVVEYLEKHAVVEDFKSHVRAIVDVSVQNYLERNFNHLCVSFGCTGGQHRSVYFAHQLADYLRKKYPMIKVVERHTEQPHLLFP